MAQTSIHVCPVKAGSEKHNSRAKQLDYVNSSLSHLNESYRYSATSIDTRLQEIARDYAEHHGKKLHSKATPIREAVVVLDESVTMDNIKAACEECRKEFGIRAMQIYIHRDEGHEDKKSGKWKPNLHAHIVFDWYNQEKHTTCKLSREDTAKMQTIFADALGMKRGKSSDKSHLSAQQYKIEAEIANLEKKRSEAKKTGIIDAIKVAALDKVEESETYKAAQASEEAAKNQVLLLTAEVEDLRQQNQELEKEVQAAHRRSQENLDGVGKIQRERDALREEHRINSIWIDAWEGFRQLVKGNKSGLAAIRAAAIKFAQELKSTIGQAAYILLGMCPGLTRNQKNTIWPEVNDYAGQIERELRDIRQNQEPEPEQERSRGWHM